jgi:hypothetical protein
MFTTAQVKLDELLLTLHQVASDLEEAMIVGHGESELRS